MPFIYAGVGICFEVNEAVTAAAAIVIVILVSLLCTRIQRGNCIIH